MNQRDISFKKKHTTLKTKKLALKGLPIIVKDKKATAQPCSRIQFDNANLCLACLFG